MPADILLVSPPWRRPDASCPALGTLRPLLRRAGLDTDTLHATLLMRPVPLDDEMLSSYAAHFFVCSLVPDHPVEAVLQAVEERLLRDVSLQGLRLPAEQLSCAALGLDRERLRAGCVAAIETAEACVEACVERIVAGGYRVVGLSVTFENQLTAALAIARRLEARNPAIRVVLGGAACFETLSEAVVAAFPEVDVVCYTEGEAVIEPLMRALLEGSPLDDIAGITFRGADGAVRRNPPPPLTRDLDALPVPDYADFVAQLEASPWRELRPRLRFETSRGCWWGEKHHCSFCGLNATGMAFRRKSPERALEEIATLYASYPTARRLECVDNILDTGYLTTLLPRLAELERAPDRPLRIFWEAKSNLRRDQLAAMAAAGIDYIQPGIESFSDGVLQLMKKGATALTQIQLVKWAYELGIHLAYNLLLRSPGEEASWYRDMTALIPRISHLPPPMTVSPVWLERFSPYHMHPADYGISGLRPRPYYAALYPGMDVDLDAVAYVFDYDHDNLSDPELAEAHRGLLRSVTAWQLGWRDGLAYCTDDGDVVTLHDHRGGESHRLALHGDEARLYRFLGRARTRASVRRELGLAGEVDATLDAWVASLIVYEHAETGALLATLPVRAVAGP